MLCIMVMELFWFEKNCATDLLSVMMTTGFCNPRDLCPFHLNANFIAEI